MSLFNGNNNDSLEKATKSTIYSVNMSSLCPNPKQLTPSISENCIDLNEIPQTTTFSFGIKKTNPLTATSNIVNTISIATSKLINEKENIMKQNDELRLSISQNKNLVDFLQNKIHYTKNGLFQSKSFNGTVGFKTGMSTFQSFEYLNQSKPTSSVTLPYLLSTIETSSSNTTSSFLGTNTRISSLTEVNVQSLTEISSVNTTTTTSCASAGDGYAKKISTEQLTASLVTETNKSSASSGKTKVLSYWRPRKKDFKIVYQRDSGNYFYINENGQHIGVRQDKVITSFIDATSAQASTHALSNDTEVSNGAPNKFESLKKKPINTSPFYSSLLKQQFITNVASKNVEENLNVADTNTSLASNDSSDKTSVVLAKKPFLLKPSTLISNKVKSFSIETTFYTTTTTTPGVCEGEFSNNKQPKSNNNNNEIKNSYETLSDKNKKLNEDKKNLQAHKNLTFGSNNENSTSKNSSSLQINNPFLEKKKNFK